MQYMPLFVDIHNRMILFIGGGEVALRKARQFSEAGAQLTVIAPEIKQEFNELPNVCLEYRKANENDISEKYFAVIFASNDKETNEILSKICRKKRIIVDRCDDHTKSDFVTGSITTSGSIINSTTSGGIPALSRFINEEIKNLLTPELTELNKLLSETRYEILSSPRLGKEYLKKIISKETLQRIKNEGINKIRQEILRCL